MPVFLKNLFFVSTFSLLAGCVTGQQSGGGYSGELDQDIAELKGIAEELEKNQVAISEQLKWANALPKGIEDSEAFEQLVGKSQGKAPEAENSIAVSDAQNTQSVVTSTGAGTATSNTSANSEPLTPSKQIVNQFDGFGIEGLLARNKQNAELQAQLDVAEASASQDAVNANNQTVSTGSASSVSNVVQVNSQSSNLQANNAQATEPVIPGIADLPRAPQPGECYANLWRKPVYRTISEVVKIKDEEKIIEVVPAVYRNVTENVLVREASTRIEPVPAIYSEVEESVEVKAAEQAWLIGLEADAPKASVELLREVQNTGFNLAGNAVGNVCYHEHYYPAKFETFTEQVLIREESERVEVIPAQYGMVEKSVLVEPEKERMIPIPAVYEEVTETIVESPARNEWQQCGGGSGYGQVMCYVNVPATYSTITKRNLVSPATTRIETIPARYKTVSVREVIVEAKEVKVTEPAQYAVITKRRQIAEPVYNWHEVTANSDTSIARTGRKLCYRETPAEYRSVTKQQLVQPASSRTVQIPAEFSLVDVQQLVKSEETKVTTIPAQYETISSQELMQPGRMEWRAIMCEPDFTESRILEIQRALYERGYDIPTLDGRFGARTLKALNRFQEDHNLPVDQHVNLESLRVLGVSSN